MKKESTLFLVKLMIYSHNKLIKLLELKNYNRRKIINKMNFFIDENYSKYLSQKILFTKLFNDYYDGKIDFDDIYSFIVSNEDNEFEGLNQQISQKIYLEFFCSLYHFGNRYIDNYKDHIMCLSHKTLLCRDININPFLSSFVKIYSKVYLTLYCKDWFKYLAFLTIFSRDLRGYNYE